MQHRRALVGFVLALLLPLSADAGIFGGKVQVVLPCFNGGILALVGPPIGGLYFWSPATKTTNGPPSHPGQWVMGLTGIPYVCLISVFPIITTPAIMMTLLGSSR